MNMNKNIKKRMLCMQYKYKKECYVKQSEDEL